jgi:hypothetical protein
MATLSDVTVLAVAALLAITGYLRLQQIKEAIDNLNTRGGPPPMHPSPAGDDSLLRPNSRKSATQK